MKQTFKKSLSIILAAAILICSAPLTGLLDLELPDFGGFKKLASSVSAFFDGFSTKAEAAISGECGDNVTWTFNESTGTLTISGTGDMWDYETFGAPWYYFDNEKVLIVEDGITSIGNCAFEYCDFTKAVLPDSIEKIGEYSFTYCYKLKSVSIPSNVAYIGEAAFYDSGITEVNFGNKLTEISNNAFSSCVNLSSVSISNSITRIGDNSFSNCRNLKSIIIPDSVIKIGHGAFDGCDNLMNISISSNLSFLGYSAFESTAFYNDSSNWNNNTLYICDYLIEVGDNFSGVLKVKNGTKIISEDAAYNCDGITGLEFPDTLKIICDDAFMNCDGLTVIKIPSFVKHIGNRAFLGCNELTEVEFQNGIEHIGDEAFDNCEKIINLSLPNSLSTIGYSAFASCDRMESIALGNNISKIGESVFQGTKFYETESNWTNDVLYLNNYLIGVKEDFGDLEQYELRPDTRTIADNVFTYLTPGSFKISPNNQYYSCDEHGVLFNKDKTLLIRCPNAQNSNAELLNYNIPETVVEIADNAFRYCYNLNKISFGGNVTKIGKYAFYNCDNIRNLILGNNVESIGESAFLYCDGLTNVVITDSVKTIGEEAFYRCKSIKTISFGNKLEIIEAEAFAYCESLTEIILPNSLKHIENGAFLDCVSLKNISIGRNTVLIGSFGHNWGSVFDGCILEAISISPDNTSYLADTGSVVYDKNRKYLFKYPAANEADTYIISDTVQYIESRAFESAYRLKSIYIPQTVRWSNGIGYAAFEGCSGLTDVYYGGTETAWNALSLGSDNEPLLNATIHYNFVPEGGGEVTPPAEDDYSTQNIKVMSYNVYVKDGNVKGITNGKTYDCSYETRTRYIVQSINENMPDSIGLQELTSEMRTFLETFEDLNGGILSVNYAGVGEYRSKSGNNNEASLIYYNKNKFTLKESGTFWLSESGEKYSKHTGSEYPRICTYALLENKATGQQYLHVNTHLEHDHSSKDGGSNNAAIFSSEKIIDFVNKKFPNIPVVITGDFNQKKDSAPYNNFINAGYTDTRDVYSGNLNTYINSYNQGEDKKAYGAKVIDHVLVNEYFNNGIESYTVYNEDYSNSDKYGNLALDYPYPSDHHPIVVELKATYSGDIISSKEIKFGENKSVEVVLDDDWFEKSNTEYNHALAQFCADYVMMGYCYNDDTVKGYLSQMGFDTVDSCMNAGRDEVNYFIASKDITVNGETETLVFAGFIGSYKKQWYSNFDPYGTERDNWKKRNAPYSDSNEKGKVHLGFADAREYVYAKLKKFIADNNIDKENMKLLISGHSRGAATANLLAAKLIDETYANSSTALVNRNSIYTYTFATPNVASTQKNVFDSKYKCIFNIVNPEDFVTKVLPNSWGYYRYGKTYVLPSQTNDKNWKSYLKAMNKCFAQYKFGEIYDPYNDGEKTTYKIVEKFTKNINNLDEFYEKDIWAYNISGMIPQFMKPYDFFKDSLLGYLSEQNKAGGLNLAVAILLYGKTVYQDMIAYFFNPDLLLDASLNPGVDPGGKFKQAHQMETYCAYMNAMTSSQIKQTRLYYENTVNCPVDIEIYDNATNELVGKITNNVVDETVAAGENAIVMDVEGDSKSFYLPSNGDYRIVLTGNDDGTMDYSVSSIDSDLGETERLNFFDVEIENGVSMEGEINAEEFVLEEYTLNHEENGVIEPTEKLEGDELRDISVSITTEGAGYADGNIAVTSGDYVTVTATANENNNFIGWYENEVLVSNDAEYSFVAKENRNLVAKFTNNYAIEWNVDGEITTTYCESGSAITTLENPAKSGYKFLGWTPAIPDVMPAENLSFTAVFEALFTSEIRKPSTTTISYGDSIILHADIIGELPEGYYVEWTASNGNFEWTANGATCEISPEKSGDTTFIATIYDADGNPVSVDEQTMTSKAGFFQKIIAFFKKLFGLTKTIPNVFKF